MSDGLTDMDILESMDWLVTHGLAISFIQDGEMRYKIALPRHMKNTLPKVARKRHGKDAEALVKSALHRVRDGKKNVVFPPEDRWIIGMAICVYDLTPEQWREDVPQNDVNDAIRFFWAVYFMLESSSNYVSDKEW